MVASVSGSENSNGVVVDAVSNSSTDERGAAPVVQPKRKRGRPKKVKIAEPGSSTSKAEVLETTTEEEEEWDFFGELARHLENGDGATLEEDDLKTPTAIDVELAAETATDKANGETLHGLIIRVYTLNSF